MPLKVNFCNSTWIDRPHMGTSQWITCNYQSLFYKWVSNTWHHKKVGNSWQRVGHVQYIYIWPCRFSTHVKHLLGHFVTHSWLKWLHLMECILNIIPRPSMKFNINPNFLKINHKYDWVLQLNVLCD
jgi:hypothetical protein